MNEHKPHHDAPSDEQATLNTIAVQMKHLQDKVDLLEATNKSQSKDITTAKNSTKKAEEDAKYSSKTVMGGIIGLVGMKLGALIGAKVGAVTSLSNVKVMDASRLPLLSSLKNKIVANETIAETAKAMLMKPETFAKLLVNSKAWALVGAVVVGVPTFTLGYKRGDRLAKATDLIKKPIDSFHRLTESESDFIKENPDHPLAKKGITDWQDKVQNSRAPTLEASR